MKYAICVVAAAAVRREPSHRSEMVNQLLFGEVMEVVEEAKEWVKIKLLYDHYEGWLTQHLIEEIAAEVALPPLHYIATGLTNPVTVPTELINAPMGASLTGFDKETRLLWDNKHKYHGTFAIVPSAVSADRLLKLVQAWMNAPYLWGGRTFMGVDCSGLVQVLFKVLGIPLLRDAQQQAKEGSEVENIASAKTGDLAFFKNEDGRIVHVGMVISQDQIVHASGKVRIDRLTGKGIIHTTSGEKTHILASIRSYF